MMAESVLNWENLLTKSREFLRSFLASIKWFLKAIFRLISGNSIVLITLLVIFTLPSLLMTYWIHFPPEITTSFGSEKWYQTTNWRHYFFWYFSITGSVDVVWKILGPLLIALSAGRTFKEGMNIQSAVLFLWLLIVYLNSDYLFNLLTEINDVIVSNNMEANNSIGEPGTAISNLHSRPLFNLSGLVDYLNNLSSLVITSIMIIIGISTANSNQG